MNDQQRMIVLHHEAAQEGRAWRWLQEILEGHHDEFVSPSPAEERLPAISAFACVMLCLHGMAATSALRLRELVGSPRREGSP